MTKIRTGSKQPPALGFRLFDVANQKPLFVAREKTISSSHKRHIKTKFTVDTLDLPSGGYARDGNYLELIPAPIGDPSVSAFEGETYLAVVVKNTDRDIFVALPVVEGVK